MIDSEPFAPTEDSVKDRSEINAQLGGRTVTERNWVLGSDWMADVVGRNADDAQQSAQCSLHHLDLEQ